MNSKQGTMSNVWENNLILQKADLLAHLIYAATKSFPKSELYGITSQIRRASLSVVLNMIEGYSRFRRASHLYFLEIAFGSLKETEYLIEFSSRESLMKESDTRKMQNLCEEISKMLYSKIKTMKAK